MKAPRISRILAAASVLVALMAGQNALAGAGSLDPTFGISGTTSLSTWIGCSALAVQSDGKLLITSPVGLSGSRDFAVLRLNADGTDDPTFATDGTGTVGFHDGFYPTTYYDDIPSAIGVQSTGRIVVAGSVDIGNKHCFGVTGVTTTGTLDQSFAPSFLAILSGKAITSIGSSDAFPTCLAVQPDDKVVVAGYCYSGTNSDFAVARYTSAGELDTGFATSGTIAVGFFSSFLGVPPYEDYAEAVVLQSTGNIVVGGYTITGTTTSFAATRLTTVGAVDSTFNPGLLNAGRLIISFPTGNAKAMSAAVQSDDKILLAGYASNGTNDDFALVRCAASGTLDPTFGNGGRVLTPIGNGKDRALNVLVQADGKIVVCGVSNNGTNDDFAVVRYNSDGSLDTDFGNGGKVVTDFGLIDSAVAMTIQDGSKILAVGNRATSLLAGAGRTALARFNGCAAKQDVRLGLSAAVPVGDDVYNETGAGQVQKAAVRHGGGRKTVLIGIQNDSTGTDSFEVRGTPGNSKFSVKYFSGLTDVTAAVVAGTFETSPLAPGETFMLTAKIKAKTQRVGARRTLLIDAESMSDPGVEDCAIIKAVAK